MGVAADGLTPIANSTNGGSGVLSVDYSDDVVIGGSEVGAINVIGASLGHGIAPDHADNLLIEGNYIGLGYDGETVLGNSSSGFGEGLAISNVTNSLIKNNKLAGWANGGLNFNSGVNTSVTVIGNTVFNNINNGISVYNGENLTITENRVYDNAGTTNIFVLGANGFGAVVGGLKIKSNIIGFLPDNSPTANNPVGIIILGDAPNVIIGGVEPGEGNIIAANKGAGVLVAAFTAQAFDVTLNAQKVSILGNSIYSNTSTNFFSGQNGLGIDLATAIDTDPSPDGQPNTYTGTGVTLNDFSDSDTGPNNSINFPVLNSVTQNGTLTSINFNLDDAGSPTGQYRVEFFSSDTADPSGYGEGRTYLGYTTVSNGVNQTATLTLPSGTNLSGKSISATTTAIDNTTDSGFGDTSEFSRVVLVPLPSNGISGSLARTGENIAPLLLVATTCTVLASSVLLTRKLSR